MNQTPPPQSTQTGPSKLIIRSEVLAVIRHLTSRVDPPRQEMAKQLKRLQDITNQGHVQDILVKELWRCQNSETMRVITQLLMEIGTLEDLQEPLWTLIRDPQAADDIKDTANLVLRHLGDNTDPDLYLEYLSDPEGLISRETVRMLAVSTENPEALIDFIDFILSLGETDQVRMLSSLEEEYPAEYLVNIYLPLLESDPTPSLWEQIIEFLGATKSNKAMQVLDRLSKWPDERLPIPKKLIEKSMKQLQLSGASTAVENSTDEEQPALIKDTQPYQCFATITDGIGNQGLIFSRQRTNGDIAMMSIALNDTHGIIDCFGFYQLSLADFHRIVDKFHEATTKIAVSPEYCAYKLKLAAQLNETQCYRLPYEFRCWQPLLDEIDTSPPEILSKLPEEWIRKEWFPETSNLYQHPDFQSWFLEQGDEPVVNAWLSKVPDMVKTETQKENPDLDKLGHDFEILADNLMRALLETPWRSLLSNRLTEAAYLLDCQNTHTFRNLAATEVFKLSTVTDTTARLIGFPRAYGRRCILEELLRMRAASADYDTLTAVTDAVMTRWNI